jgi:hypothetical protein
MASFCKPSDAGLIIDSKNTVQQRGHISLMSGRIVGC